MDRLKKLVLKQRTQPQQKSIGTVRLTDFPPQPFQDEEKPAIPPAKFGVGDFVRTIGYAYSGTVIKAIYDENGGWMYRVSDGVVDAPSWVTWPECILTSPPYALGQIVYYVFCGLDYIEAKVVGIRHGMKHTWIYTVEADMGSLGVETATWGDEYLTDLPPRPARVLNKR